MFVTYVKIYEHIYEEIDDKPLAGGLTRAERGSFAGATRQDILRYLEELRKKNPPGMLLHLSDTCPSSLASGAGRSLSPVSGALSPTGSMMTPSLPQLIAAVEDDDDEDMATMADLLLAMRHNGPNRNSNRSNASSQSSQESALSTSANVTPVGSHQVSFITAYIMR